MFESCAFETERLQVMEWHAGETGQWPGPDLIQVVQSILTPAVTHPLPTGWQGRYSTDRARAWIGERAVDSTVLVATERSNGKKVGLMLLSEANSEEGGSDFHVGYLLAEQAWGRGYASELVAGFVDWCRQQRALLVLFAGVGPDNRASERVLEKCGFRPVGADRDKTESGDQTYRLDLRQPNTAFCISESHRRCTGLCREQDS